MKKQETVIFNLGNKSFPSRSSVQEGIRGVKHTRWHHVMSAIWILAGAITFILALFELFSGLLISTLILAASAQLATFFGLEAETLSGLTLQALGEWKTPIAVAEFTLSGLFFICAYYTRRLIARSEYIIELEQAEPEEKQVHEYTEREEYEAAE